ncbi:uncharacterized protein LOC131243916 isoform X1 [Magnolia sinica]|uniref:uncharacterized protein LOC131243916 isoform X1 n=2 Tax=Magnolia sinica TaxID=86752 RepID=UPI0026591E94|nr:uncharacterized protein LOC131243916 isoform X1 [Magnolia sinica]XP_058099516.1 uncharacterized protein LOC131243916 isoform X1 [Magnolia sinica]
MGWMIHTYHVGPTSARYDDSAISSDLKQNQENPIYFLIFQIAEKQDQKKIAGMGLWTLLEGFLLLANALAILNEDRFLAPRGWSFSEVPGVRTKSLKGQVIGLIYATQYLRLPLMALNAITIIVMLVSG